MKFIKKVLILLSLLSFMSVPVWAAGTCTIAPFGGTHVSGSPMKVLLVTCTADAADASYPTITTDECTGIRCTELIRGRSLVAADIVFGTTTPDASFTIVLNPSYSSDIDLLEGVLTTIDGTGVDLRKFIIEATEPAMAPIAGALSVVTSLNSTNSAIYYLYLYFR